MTAAAAKQEAIRFTLDGQEIEAVPGETIWEAAARYGTRIPHLCYSPEPGYRADGNCRACMVEIEGERVLAASCIREARDGMVVKSASERAEKARSMVFELLIADQPARETSHDPESKFWHWASDIGVNESRFPQRETWQPDVSHTAMAVNLDACINCNLCVRACREVQVNDVIGMAYRGHGAKVIFDFDDPMWPAASACRPARPAPSWRPTCWTRRVRASSSRTAPSTASALTAASAARPRSTSRTTRSSTSTGATARPTRTDSVSRAVSAGTISTARTA